MITDLPIFERASEFARHASARQRLIAENLAHADTPGYRARDLETFSLPRDTGFVPHATRPDHDGRSLGRNFREIELDRAASPNGNTVVVEDQMVLAAEAESQHRLAFSVYDKAIQLLRLGLGRVR